MGAGVPVGAREEGPTGSCRPPGMRTKTRTLKSPCPALANPESRTGAPRDSRPEFPRNQDAPASSRMNRSLRTPRATRVNSNCVAGSYVGHRERPARRSPVPTTLSEHSASPKSTSTRDSMKTPASRASVSAGVIVIFPSQTALNIALTTRPACPTDGGTSRSRGSRRRARPARIAVSGVRRGGMRRIVHVSRGNGSAQLGGRLDAQVECLGDAVQNGRRSLRTGALVRSGIHVKRNRGRIMKGCSVPSFPTRRNMPGPSPNVPSVPAYRSPHRHTTIRALPSGGVAQAALASCESGSASDRPAWRRNTPSNQMAILW